MIFREVLVSRSFADELNQLRDQGLYRRVRSIRSGGAASLFQRSFSGLADHPI